MKKLRTLHRTLRYWAFRITGFAFIIIGSILTVYAISSMLTRNANDQGQGLLITVPITVVGIFFVWFRPFRPK
jgi:hypothetical protein